MTDKEAMAMALEALEYIDDGANNQGAHTGISWRCVSNKAQPAITSLRQAIAEAEGQEKALQALHNENERLGLYKDAYAEQEPVAWRTFDGEGGYDYRTYDTNEDYADEWEKRNPNHKGWVEPLYKDPKPCPTCEALARTVMLDQTSHDTRPQPQRTEQETVIDKSAAIRIATALGWEPKREWVGLTDEEMDDLAEFHGLDFMSYAPFTRAIEAKLKDKNGYAEENT